MWLLYSISKRLEHHTYTIWQPWELHQTLKRVTDAQHLQTPITARMNPIFPFCWKVFCPPTDVYVNTDKTDKKRSEVAGLVESKTQKCTALLSLWQIACVCFIKIRLWERRFTDAIAAFWQIAHMEDSSCKHRVHRASVLLFTIIAALRRRRWTFYTSLAKIFIVI